MLEIDPRENAHRMLAVPPSGGAIAAVRPGLCLQNLRPRAILDQVVREQLRFGPVVRRVLASPVYQHFSEGAPGLKELAVLGHALRLLRRIDPAQPEIDVVVLDAPATGHGVSLLAAPQLVSEVIQSGPFGELAGELATFLGDPSACGVVVTTAAEEMPVQEALELLASLRERLARAGRAGGGERPLPCAAAGGAAAARIRSAGLWAERRRVNDEERERLYRVWQGPRWELPLLPFDRSPELLDALHRALLAGGATA